MKTDNPPEDLLDTSFAEKLHIGGQEAKTGWKILNAQDKEGVDYVGDIRDLSQFADNHFDIVYASHVLEHVNQKELLPTVQGIHRILRPGGKFFVSVPDMTTLCHIYVDKNANQEDRFNIMRMIFGGQIDEYDFHYIGINDELLLYSLSDSGFEQAYRVPEFNIFQDTSSMKYGGVLISLNAVAIK